jgi:tetratricopeptide (TPR) repeat protein
MSRRITLLLFLSGCLFATDKTFVREYTYQASDYDSKVTSRANALEQVKRILLEEVSVFMKSEVDWTQTEELIEGKYEFKDFYEQKITSITAGVTETKILEEKWNGVVYWIKAEITLDPDDTKSKIDEIVQNNEKLKELEDVKMRADDALAEIERLKKELAQSKSDAEQLRLTKAYNKEADALSATDWFIKGYNAAMDKEYDKSISFFSRVIELDPDDAVALITIRNPQVVIGNSIIRI